MDVRYRRSFLRDLKKLKKRPIYGAVFALAFETLPEAGELAQIPGVKPMHGHPRRYRIRKGSYWRAPIPAPRCLRKKLWKGSLMSALG